MDATDATVAGRVAVSPIVVRLELVPRKPKAKGPIEVRATVDNLSAARVPEVVVSLAATPPSLVLKPVEPRSIRNLAAGRAAEATWSLCAPTGGTFALVALATAGEASVQSVALAVTLAPSRC